MASSRSKYNLLVVAHPDDETIFFGALLLTRRSHPWHVICVTDGNADGQGRKRRKQFDTACRLLKVKTTSWLEFPDVFTQRLDIERLAEHLRGLPRPQEVFTHGIVGEYGHPHHQDVSYAVHSVFADHPRVYSTAYNCYPEFVVKLNSKQFDKKGYILSRVYGSETQRFANLLPTTAVESFVRLEKKEVDALYGFFTSFKKPRLGVLKAYRWYWSYLKLHAGQPIRRLF